MTPSTQNPVKNDAVPPIETIKKKAEKKIVSSKFFYEKSKIYFTKKIRNGKKNSAFVSNQRILFDDSNSSDTAQKFVRINQRFIRINEYIRIDAVLHAFTIDARLLLIVIAKFQQHLSVWSNTILQFFISTNWLRL